MFQVLKEWPYVSRHPSDLRLLDPQPYLSLDWEWRIRDNKPTILGASDGVRTVSVPHEDGKPFLLELLANRPQTKILGHNFLSSDLGVAREEGILIAPEQVDDTILWHWLTNMSLCKGTKKADDEEGAKRGRGFMNLWTMCGFYTDAPNWKDCIGAGCEGSGRPCPRHNAFGYNGNDCYWPVHAMPHMLRRAKLMGVDKLYPLHRDVAVILAKMSERGLLIDVPYVDTLRKDFESECERIEREFASFGLNPNSNPKVIDYFAKRGIKLEDNKEETIRQACDEHDDAHLELLLEFKELGNGPDRWFAPRKFDWDKNEWKGYVDEYGFIHCNLNFFTSTGRFACSNPNLQNISKRRRDRRTGESLGKRVRRAVIAPEGFWLYRADLKNAENRVFLHLSGHTDIPDIDFHSWMRDTIGIKEDDPFALTLGSARDAAKSVTHATDYLEGLVLLYPGEERSPKVRKEVEIGARLIFPEWTVWGKTVSFTGINLARRAFGDATYESRRRALSVQMKYFNAFSKVRSLQQHITTQVEKERCVRPPTGYVLGSYGPELDQLKTAAATWGQNPVAHVTKLALKNAENHPHLTQVLQVHDELLFYADKRHEPKEVYKWIRECMEVEMPEIPGMIIPAEPSHGPNWADQKSI